MTTRTFPKMPTLQATWAPVYLEPIMHSGERITVGIAAVAANGETIVVPSLSEKQLTCIFGEREAASLFNIVQLALDSLSEGLKESPSLAAWKAPFSGLVLGEHRQTMGDTLPSVIQMAMRLSASFSAMSWNLEQMPTADSIAAHALDDDRWPRQVHDAVFHRNPDFEGHFNRSVAVIQGARPAKFDFFGRRYVANLGKLIPTSKRLSTLQANAKARLWDLAQLREAPGTENISAFELILWRPSAQDPAYTEKEIRALGDAILELTEEAKREDLITVPVLSAAEASDRIILMEAA